LVFGVIELSRFFLVYSSVYTASREASRFASSVGNTNNVNYLDCNSIAERAVFSGSFGGVQIDDITIYYESTPGNIVASCPNVDKDSKPLVGNCHDGSINCISNPPEQYIPALGDRVLVDIETEFGSILGIVPNLPVRAVNGRTIMKEIKILIPPATRPLCPENVSFAGPLYQSEDDLTKISIDVINDSTISYYLIYQINDIYWVTNEDAPKIVEIRWGEGQIWVPSDLDEPKDEIIDNELPTFNIESWDEGVGRYLPAKVNEEDSPSPTTLDFVFETEVNKDELQLLQLTFNLVVWNNAGKFDDICDPVY